MTDTNTTTTETTTAKAAKPKPPTEHPVCLCGCEAETKAKSRFLPGHDARTKGFLQRSFRALRRSAAVMRAAGRKKFGVPLSLGGPSSASPAGAAAVPGWRQDARRFHPRFARVAVTLLSAEALATATAAALPPRRGKTLRMPAS